jgi:hypothetical protein
MRRSAATGMAVRSPSGDCCSLLAALPNWLGVASKRRRILGDHCSCEAPRDLPGARSRTFHPVSSKTPLFIALVFLLVFLKSLRTPLLIATHFSRNLYLLRHAQITNHNAS